MPDFEVVSKFKPGGDQPAAIKALSDGIKRGDRFQTLLGITGSGKSATIAWTIEAVQKTTLVLAPNKSLAAQLATEFREFFPKNKVEFFVSYFDFYRPEYYHAASDTYASKTSAVNDDIERFRHAATSALLNRKDTIICASISCIYGIGDPEEYGNQMVYLQVGKEYELQGIAQKLVDIRYNRNDTTLIRGTFRIRGDVFELHPAGEEFPLRLEFFGNELESIKYINPATGEIIAPVSDTTIYPASHYVTSDTKIKRALLSIQEELQERLGELKAEGKLVEAQRLQQRTENDLEMLEQTGYCNSIENYSRHFDGRAPGQPSTTLLDYFPDDYLMIVDESHITVGQIQAQIASDRSRKQTLVDHGFRLKSSLDNRPLTFEETFARINQGIFLSATPNRFEIKESSQIVEQIRRPTGLLDPIIRVESTENQMDKVLKEIKDRAIKNERVILATITKKLAEDVTDYLVENGIKAKYMHADVSTIDRIQMLQDLRAGKFDVIVAINLLREGISLSDVSLLVVFNADLPSFLRSTTSLIQLIGRSARNKNGTVMLMADKMTEAMRQAISETERRRELQMKYNEENNIDPQSVIDATNNILDSIRPQSNDSTTSKAEIPTNLSTEEVARILSTLEEEMAEVASEMKFEQAAELRDEIEQIRRQYNLL